MAFDEGEIAMEPNLFFAWALVPDEMNIRLAIRTRARDVNKFFIEISLKFVTARLCVELADIIVFVSSVI